MLVAYTMARRSALENFYDEDASDQHWAEAGFDDAKPCYVTSWRRLCELESDECVDIFEPADDRMIGIARAHEPCVGRENHIDSTSIHSRGRLHHACRDEEACKARTKATKEKMPAILEAASEQQVREGRAADAKLDIEDDDVEVTAEIIEDADDQEGPYAHYVIVNGHRYGCEDPDAACSVGERAANQGTET